LKLLQTLEITRFPRQNGRKRVHVTHTGVSAGQVDVLL